MTHFADTSCKFIKILKTRREEEGSEFDLECAIEREDVAVTWYYNDVEITPRNNANFDHFEFIEDKKKRILRIRDCPMSAAGKYKCTTNDDETTCELLVYLKNKVLRGLEDKSVWQGESVTFECQFADETAKPTWYWRGERVLDITDEKYEIKKLEKGVHQLIIHDCKVEDFGKVECCVADLKTVATLEVKKKEEKPKIEAEDQEDDSGRIKGKYKGNV